MVQKVSLSMTEDIASEINDVSVAVDDVASALTALDASLGTASTRNVGTGANDVVETSELDTRIGTSGNLGTAAQKNFGTADGNLPEYQEAVVELGGDFNAGEEVTIVRIGNLVCISSKISLVHTAGVTASAIGVVPTWARPTVQNRFNISSAIDTGTETIFTNVDITESGNFVTRYINGVGATVSRSSTGGGISISYII